MDEEEQFVNIDLNDDNICSVCKLETETGTMSFCHVCFELSIEGKTTDHLLTKMTCKQSDVFAPFTSYCFRATPWMQCSCHCVNAPTLKKPKHPHWIFVWCVILISSFTGWIPVVSLMWMDQYWSLLPRVCSVSTNPFCKKTFTFFFYLSSHHSKYALAPTAVLKPRNVSDFVMSRMMVLQKCFIPPLQEERIRYVRGNGPAGPKPSLK